MRPDKVVTTFLTLMVDKITLPSKHYHTDKLLVFLNVTLRTFLHMNMLLVTELKVEKGFWTRDETYSRTSRSTATKQYVGLYVICINVIGSLKFTYSEKTLIISTTVAHHESYGQVLYI